MGVIALGTATPSCPSRADFVLLQARKAPVARMAGAGHGRPPPGLAPSAGPERPWAGGPAGEPPTCPGEEANPFSFKEFVRSKKQITSRSEVKSHRDLLLPPGPGSTASPKEASSFSLLLDDSILSPKSLGPTLSFREPFFPDPTATNSFLEEEEEEDDWSSTYQPSAVEEALLSGISSPSLGSTFDSSYGDPAVHPAFSPWQLREGSDGLCPSPLGKGDQSKAVDREDPRDGFQMPHQRSYEELNQENAQLRKKIVQLQTVAETQTERVQQLERTLEESKQKEEKEARDLEAMVQQVEENLDLMTKRAMKAETSAVKLKQENALLQVQMENYRLENEALRSGHLANLAVVKQNAGAALENILTVLTKSRASIKQLISGAETLQLVADLLKSIDRISEVPQDSL